MVQSIPGELSMEETNILNAASNTESGYVTQRQLMEDLGYVIKKQALELLDNSFFFLAGPITVQKQLWKKYWARVFAGLIRNQVNQVTGFPVCFLVVMLRLLPHSILVKKSPSPNKYVHLHI